ncbi:MAG: excinuclease ABC subunit UvrC [Rhodospirillaceae bacterium]|jgi:excinuclease ABC subunit C|nr:excinuclease ABC subunit UvrC [Rhodospirillaceae bacterium]MBT6204843.1 excinuclease ABC subunit UvrC [Rhodospirillaceae bacterium]MBT6510672.1 excinuclease ABC subunit UvrC [Rhodospirillaceae bacterium]
MSKADRDARPAPENAGPATELPERASGERGAAAIKAALKTMPASPGVYRMLSDKGEVLYVGKARILKQRVTAYTQPGRLDPRLHRMVANTASMEVLTTGTEAEALLLEANLIKKLKPRYNVVLRDDKSFPYILLRLDHDWPQVIKHRGARRKKGEYFGPFASAGSVNQTVTALQRAFPLRSCTDHVFTNRTRPCLQHQIKRCVAPCVGLVAPDDYERLVEETRAFLKGRTREVQDKLAGRMQEAADDLDFERAAGFRDRIRALNHIQAHQGINVQAIDEADVVAMHQAGGQCCVQVFFIRQGRNYGNRAYYPTRTKDQSEAEVVAAFLGQFYEDKEVPRLVLVSALPDDHALITEALSTRAGRKVEISVPQRGDRRTLLRHALHNAKDALARRRAESASQRELLEGLADRLGLEAPPQRIEVYDNSHIQGAQPVGGMIVAGPEGLLKNQYRKFNIKGEAGSQDELGGDDYGMMKEVLKRRFSRLLKEDPERDQGMWPDLVIVDGGLGQLTVALEVFEELGVTDVALCGVAKGPDRDAGREKFFLPGVSPFLLPERDPVLYFVQRMRDEAHRFAIGAHRSKRTNQIGRSLLDDIAGIGPRRKKALLHHFGSAKAVADAGLTDLERVDGIDRTVAQKIWDHFHPNA